MGKITGPATKRALIDKANTTVVAITSAAAFILVFSLVATKTLISQASYQNRVISAKHAAVKQLKDDVSAGKDLKTSYQAFVSTAQNTIGGNPGGNGPQDGDNSKIILDALPSSYDFPALTTSLEKLLTSSGLSIGGITGTDAELTQGSNLVSSSPTVVPMPFQVAVSGNYSAIQGLIGEFEHSIRPFQIQTMQITGSQSQLTMNITAQTFYQPGKTFSTQKTTVVK